jgi:hypothetical protein
MSEHPPLPPLLAYQVYEGPRMLCMIVPVRRGELEAFQPEARLLSSDAQLPKEFDAWYASRTDFLTQWQVPDSEARKQKWQKEYFHGKGTTGTTAPEHQVKLSLREFKPTGAAGGPAAQGGTHE